MVMQLNFRKASIALATVAAMGTLAVPLVAQTVKNNSGADIRGNRSTNPLSPAQTRWLEATLEMGLLADPATFHVPLQIHCQGGWVQVEGSVPSEVVHHKVLHLVGDLSPVPLKDMMSIQVRAMPMAETKSAEKLTEEAAIRIQNQLGAFVTGLQVFSEDGKILVLKGTINSLEDKLQASRCLRDLAGCAGVHNQLTLMALESQGKSWNRITRDGQLTMLAGSENSLTRAPSKGVSEQAVKETQSGKTDPKSNSASAIPTTTRTNPADNQRVHRWTNSKSTDQNSIQQVDHKDQKVSAETGAAARTPVAKKSLLTPAKTTWTVIGEPSNPAPAGEVKAKVIESEKQTVQEKMEPATVSTGTKVRHELVKTTPEGSGQLLPPPTEAKPVKSVSSLVEKPHHSEVVPQATIPVVPIQTRFPAINNGVSTQTSLPPTGVVMPPLETKSGSIRLTSHGDNPTKSASNETYTMTGSPSKPRTEQMVDKMQEYGKSPSYFKQVLGDKSQTAVPNQLRTTPSTIPVQSNNPGIVTATTSPQADSSVSRSVKLDDKTVAPVVVTTTQAARVEAPIVSTVPSVGKAEYPAISTSNPEARVETPVISTGTPTSKPVAPVVPVVTTTTPDTKAVPPVISTVSSVSPGSMPVAPVISTSSTQTRVDPSVKQASVSVNSPAPPVVSTVTPVVQIQEVVSEPANPTPGYTQGKSGCCLQRPGGFINKLLPFGISCQAIPVDTPPARQTQPTPVSHIVAAKPIVEPEQTKAVEVKAPVTRVKTPQEPYVVEGYIVSAQMDSEPVSTTRNPEVIKPVSVRNNVPANPTVSIGKILVDSESIVTPSETLLESRQNLKLKIEKLARGQAWNIEVIGYQGHGMVIRMTVANYEVEKRIREQIMELSDMKIMNVHLDLKVAQ